MTDREQPTLVRGVAEGVLHLTLNRPEKRNALDIALRERLITELDTTDAAIGAVVITGADPAFCAGVDLSEMRELGGIRKRAASPADAIARCGVPVIVAVNGACWTGGLELALAADIVLASERAQFGDTHVQFGMISGWGGSARLPLAVGRQWASRLLLSGEPIDAATAEHIGLVSEVVAHDTLVDRAHALAARIAGAPRASREAVLALLREDGTLEERLRRERGAAVEFTVDSSATLARFDARERR